MGKIIRQEQNVQMLISQSPNQVQHILYIHSHIFMRQILLSRWLNCNNRLNTTPPMLTEFNTYIDA